MFMLPTTLENFISTTMQMNQLLLFHGNAQYFYTVDSNICSSTELRKVTVAYSR